MVSWVVGMLAVSIADFVVFFWDHIETIAQVPIAAFPYFAHI
jgi:hypothetical protein